MNIKEITKDIYYCGVNDRRPHLFESLWELPYGVSYNSYVVKGEKTALIDCVEIGEVETLAGNIRDVLGRKKLDYLVVNHMEPDHSGGIPVILQMYPDIEIVGNKQTVGMLKGYYGVPDRNIKEIKGGDVLDLGGLTLEFILTPMVHWPETMMTYVEARKTLFTGDALGCFGALNGGVIDEEMDCEIYFSEMYRYYSNIVGKYGRHVQKAMTQLCGKAIEYSCSTHGPVWHKELCKVIDIYDRLSKYEPDKDMATIVYGSMYGNTESIAERIARELNARGIKKIRMHNASASTLSNMITDAFRSGILVIGSPTYSMSLFPPVQQFIDAMITREVKNKVVAVFGSYTWSPAAPKLLLEATEKMHLPAVASLSVKQKGDDTMQQEIEKFAEKIMEAHKEL